MRCSNISEKCFVLLNKMLLPTSNKTARNLIADGLISEIQDFLSSNVLNKMDDELLNKSFNVLKEF